MFALYYKNDLKLAWTVPLNKLGKQCPQLKSCAYKRSKMDLARMCGWRPEGDGLVAQRAVNSTSL